MTTGLEEPAAAAGAAVGAVLLVGALALIPCCAALARALHPGALHAGPLHAGLLHAGPLHAGPLHAGPLHAGPLHSEEGPAAPRWGFAHLALVTGAFLASLLLVGGLWPVTEGELDGLGLLVRSALVLGLVGLACFAVARRTGPGPAAALGLEGRGLLRGALAGASCYAVLMPGVLGLALAWPFLLELAGHPHRTQPVLEVLLALRGAPLALALVLAVAVVPFLEELLFRGFVQPLLVRGLREAGGVAATSLLFAALHGLSAFGPVFGLSLLLGALMLRTGRLWAPWAAHALHNGLVLAVLFLVPGADDVLLAADRAQTLPTMTSYPRSDLFRALEGGAFAARNATVTGDVTLGEDVGIWFGCVVRGDDAPLSIGRRTNVQDLTLIHADTGVPNTIGAEVTIGHRCVLHGARVEDRCLIGMGAILLGGSVIGTGSIIAAGCVVREGFQVPPRSLVVGVPGKIVRAVGDEELASIARSAQGYVDKIRLYLPAGEGS